VVAFRFADVGRERDKFLREFTDIMIFEASKYIFKPPPLLSRARRVLIKPNIVPGADGWVHTSHRMMSHLVERIKQVSDADIVIIEGMADGQSMQPLYKELEYTFPRVLTLDVKDCTWVEVENPLPHPYAITNFWIPNVVLSSDYLISVTPYRVQGNNGFFSIKNLMSLLPIDKYKGEASSGWGTLLEFGLEKVLADLYFTLPFDLGIIDGTQKVISDDDSSNYRMEKFEKVYAGEPYDIDREATMGFGLEMDYLNLIEAGKAELESWG